MLGEPINKSFTTVWRIRGDGEVDNPDGVE
jgi:hypothetical protein